MGDLSHLFYMVQAHKQLYFRKREVGQLLASFWEEKSVARYRNALNSFNRDMSMYRDPESDAGLSMISLDV